MLLAGTESLLFGVCSGHTAHFIVYKRAHRSIQKTMQTTWENVTCYKMQQIWQFQQQNNIQQNQTVWKIMLETKTLSKNKKNKRKNAETSKSRKKISRLSRNK